MNAWKYFIDWWHPACPSSPGAAGGGGGGGGASNALTESGGESLSDDAGSYLTFSE